MKTQSALRAPRASGCFVCVVGPSGAGKDTIIDHARAALADEPAFVFPRRLVTRQGSAWEDHDSLSEEAFAAGVADGAFSLHWRAHGLGYALAGDLVERVDAGQVVICNLSRTRVGAARARFGRVGVVLVTAPLDTIAARLAGRGRETAETIAARLERGDAVSLDATPDVTIENVGSVEAAGARFVSYLRSLVTR